LYFDKELNKTKRKLYLTVFCNMLSDDLNFTKGLKLLQNAKAQVRAAGTAMQTQRSIVQKGSG
jgi:hypothetical protein